MPASVNVGCQGKSGPGKIHEVILVLVYDAKVFVTSMTSLGPCLLLRGRNMVNQWRTQKSRNTVEKKRTSSTRVEKRFGLVSNRYINFRKIHKHKLSVVLYCFVPGESNQRASCRAQPTHFWSQKLSETLDSAKSAAENSQLEKVKNDLEEREKLISERQKHILLTDKSDYGWAMVVEYKKHTLADDSDNEKWIFKAESRARASVNALKKKTKVPVSAESMPQAKRELYPPSQICSSLTDFVPNEETSLWEPVQIIAWLGVILNTIDGTVKATDECIEKLNAGLAELSSCPPPRKVHVSNVASVTGKSFPFQAVRVLLPVS